jgi:hypothetical protein
MTSTKPSVIAEATPVLRMGIIDAHGKGAGRGRRRADATAHPSATGRKVERAGEASSGPRDPRIAIGTQAETTDPTAMLFRPSWRTRRAVVFWLLAFAVATLASGTAGGLRVASPLSVGALLYPLAVATMLTWTRVVRGTSLAIDSTRLLYTTRDGSTTVRWRDIIGVGRRPGPGRWLLGDGLILPTPPDEPPEWRWRLLSWRALPVRFIPLDQFGAGWREGEIGRAVRRHAPPALPVNDAGRGASDAGPRKGS